MTRTISRQHGLDVLRRSTNLFIADDPTIIALTPNTRLPDGIGGYDLFPETQRDPQEFKLIAVSASLDGLTQTEGGSSRNWTYVLLGRYDAIAEIGDTWIDGNTTYRVTALMQENDYERRWSVIAFGTDPNNG